MHASMISARAIPANGTLGVFTPSEPLTPDRVMRVQARIKELEAVGYNIKTAPNWRACTGHTAGSIEARVSDFHTLLSDTSVDLLIASWGGKSAAQLVPFLDYNLIRAARKPIIAFSDGCVFLNAIAAHTGLVTFYGPNVLGKLDESTFADLRQFRCDDDLRTHPVLALDSESTEVVAPGVADGILIGGNLSSIVTSVLGSQHAPHFADILLFWESGPKTAQELDLLLTALRQSITFRSVKGLIIGDVSVIADAKWGASELTRLLSSSLQDCAIPVIHAPVFGHRALPNPAIPIGCPAHLDTDRRTLELLDSPVR